MNDTNNDNNNNGGENNNEDGLDMMELKLLEEQSLGGGSGGKGNKWVKKEVSHVQCWL